ncbi:MAG: hypothetical protein WC071_13780 [Victivallaceae bacterium]
MKRLLGLSAVVAVALWVTGCQMISGTPSAETILAKMEKATNPEHKLASIKTSVFTYNSISNDKEKSELIVSLKSPSKIRFDLKDAAGKTVIGYDGKNGWEYSGGGLRSIVGKELDELKFQAIYLAPDAKISDLFAKTVLNGSEVVDGEDCWKLSGYPAAGFKVQPIIIYISQSRNLLIETIEQQDNAGRMETVVTLFRNYKMLDGVMTPHTIVTKTGGLAVTSELTAVKWNPVLSDSIFAKP